MSAIVVELGRLIKFFVAATLLNQTILHLNEFDLHDSRAAEFGVNKICILIYRSIILEFYRRALVVGVILGDCLREVACRLYRPSCKVERPIQRSCIPHVHA